MAAYEIPGFKLGLPVAADLSAKQYHAVKLNTSGQFAAIAANTDKPIAILQDKPGAAGRAGDGMVSGVSRMVAGGTVAVDDVIGIDAAGAGVVITIGTDTTRYVVGRALSAAASGEQFTVLFDLSQPNRAS